MKSIKSNVKGWEDIIVNPSKSYKKWFSEEKKFLFSNVRRDAFVLEVGCGDGRSLKDIAEISTNLIGVDHDESAVSHARANLKQFQGIKIILSDGKNLPFNDNHFDTVTCMGTFANFGDDKYKILSEMKRVLKDNGNIIISVYSEDALDERLKAYKQANLKLKEIDRQKGRVVIDIIGDAISEQFSERELRNIFAKSSLKVIKVKKVGIAYLCLLSK